MRQGQQNRRGRGRNNNHQHNNRRGGQNPLTRTFESAGPDTKIRGTPAHIAEKYMALARDAQSSGDPVLAENYLQHAEHYNRIILAYREQQQQSGEFSGPQPVIARFRPGPQDPMGGDEFGDGDGDEFGSDASSQPMARSNEPQPSIFEGGQPQRDPAREPSRDGPREDRPQRHEGGHQRQHHNRGNGGSERSYQGDRRDRPERFDRQDRPERQDRQDRPERQDRPDRQDRPERQDRFQDRSERPERAERGGEPRFDRPPPSAEGAPELRRGPRPAPPPPAHDQPEFLRRPVRRPRREESDEAPAPVPAAGPADDTSRD